MATVVKTREEAEYMGLETKIILKMMLELVRSSKDLADFEQKLIRIANVEGILDEAETKSGIGKEEHT